ncbi:MAG: bifunctional UDP-sugar hydrolase/5'-nucleotidase [Bacteroidales bacterium]
MRRLVLFVSLLIIFQYADAQKAKKIVILETTDVHGMVLPYDYIEKKPSDVSLASVEGYIKKSGLKKEELLLLDNGDNLQGQPTEYYSNFVDTVSAHLNSRVMNFMKYDAGTVGNHDIETGHSVYDRVRKQYAFPLLAANAVSTASGEPYFKPYTIIRKGDLKIAVFGLVTPSIPEWLPPQLYSGMEFRDMVETAKKWMPVMQKEKPDLIVGLFHSGWDKNYDPGKNNYHSENGSAAVAYKVPGFNVILTGHDHALACDRIVNIAGDTVFVIDGGSHADKIGRVDISYTAQGKGKKKFRITGSLVNTREYDTDSEYMNRFRQDDSVVKTYVDKIIGESTSTVSSRDSYFGSSSFTDMIHRIQLDISGADVSFAAPLSFDVEIAKGKITVGDMFKLYRFENMLYTYSLSGEEILKYLEYSYAGWFNTMTSSDDHLIAFRTSQDGTLQVNNGRARLKNQAYNFDSAAGIDYTVDVTKPSGSRVTITSFSDGRPFELTKRYRVAVNSYRGNGGGGHLVDGAGISHEELRARLLNSTKRDLRYYIIQYVERNKVISPKPLNNWKVIPADWLQKAKEKDLQLMFGRSKQ